MEVNGKEMTNEDVRKMFENHQPQELLLIFGQKSLAAFNDTMKQHFDKVHSKPQKK